MTIAQATPLTPDQQVVIDTALKSILARWPNLAYGEFDASFGAYQIWIMRKAQESLVSIERPMAVTRTE